MGKGRRVMILGLDSAAPQLVFQRWRESLPVFSGLMEGGRWGTLRSTDPPITVPAWTSMVTSKDPGQLGCYGFRNRADRSYEPPVLADSTAVKEPTLWRILSRNRKRSIVLGVPQTYPVQPLRGLLAAGFLAPGETSDFTYPRGFREELDRLAGGYVIDVSGFRTVERGVLREQIFEMTRRRFRAIRHLLSREEWDLFMAVEMGPDRIHHAFWKHFDEGHPRHEPGDPHEQTVREYYHLLDEEIGQILEGLDPQDSLLVVSDHGARPMMGGVRINEWLRRKGYLRLLEEPPGLVPFSPLLVDWERTRAWSEGGYCARVFFNVRGREPRGVIDPRDERRFREELSLELAEMEGPTGRSLGNRVLVPEEIYGACRGIPPDLMVYLGDLGWRSIGNVGGGEIYTAENDTGPDHANHDLLGICLRYEPWRSGGREEEAAWNLLDVAPTVLDRLGIAVPDDMLGRVMA
jgi:predicted AlkP superfamily phosphohydrolase/phosphomutase